MPESFRHSMDVLQGCAGKARLAFPRLPWLGAEAEQSAASRRILCWSALQGRLVAGRSPVGANVQEQASAHEAPQAGTWLAHACPPGGLGYAEGSWPPAGGKCRRRVIEHRIFLDKRYVLTVYGGVEEDASIVIFVQFIRACRFLLLSP